MASGCRAIRARCAASTPAHARWRQLPSWAKPDDDPRRASAARCAPRSLRMECHEGGRAEGGPPRRLSWSAVSTREGEALSWSISGSIGLIGGRRGVRSATPARSSARVRCRPTRTAWRGWCSTAAPTCARCVEMMSGAIWVRDQLAAAGWRVQVAHARKVRDVAPLACKTDKVDARVLAELCRRDLVPELWVPPLEDRALRERLRRRMHLVRMRASAHEPHLRPADAVGSAALAASGCAPRTRWRCSSSAACPRSGGARSPKRWP